MNSNSQRSLNAGWTRHQQTLAARRPQARPVTILTHSGNTFTGVAWAHGEQMTRETLHADVLAARTAYQNGINSRVFTDTVTLHGETIEAVCYADIRRISEVA